MMALRLADGVATGAEFKDVCHLTLEFVGHFYFM